VGLMLVVPTRKDTELPRGTAQQSASGEIVCGESRGISNPDGLVLRTVLQPLLSKKHLESLQAPLALRQSGKG
jgi:hypothetical protein